MQTNVMGMQLYERLKDTAHLAIIYTNVGNCYSNLNLPQLAVSYHIKSLQISQQRGNNVGITKAYNNIAIVYERNGNFEKALENYRRMLGPAVATGKKTYWRSSMAISAQPTKI
ncbi:tetratricopeptide repeat protein [Mucilaginibacter antarcticus]|uniref:tetratricopeptide repeat protein n=1 Tax=Mucilaginibacter antarcticus TaxID=1855725 RepID=UPI00362CC1F2